jgi:glycosyltransferase involved in cell wall biosynthesis
MNNPLQEFFRCPTNYGNIAQKGTLAGQPGFFRFGPGLTCFGRLSSAAASSSSRSDLRDVANQLEIHDGRIALPFDLAEVASSLRMETYTGQMSDRQTRLGANPLVRKLYYWTRPILPVFVRSSLQRVWLRGGLNNSFPRWPVDQSADQLFEKVMIAAIRANGGRYIPFIWFWPDGKQAAFLLTHDVEDAAGKAFCTSLMEIDDDYGFKSSFQIVPEERYSVSEDFFDEIRERGFEANIHDLNHDGNLFRSHTEFLQRAERINEYARKFGVSGFRSGVLYRNLLWYDAFRFEYDMSVPNVGHLDPQSGGCCTIFPYFVGNVLEIPVTLTQDYSLFHILNQYSIDLWKEQIGIIKRNHGLVSVIIHPDYVMDEKPRAIYRELLAHLAELRDREGVWAALPRDVNKWWRQRNAMRIVPEGDGWRIEGEGKESARIAYAHIVNDELAFSFEPPRTAAVEIGVAASIGSTENDIEQEVCAATQPGADTLVVGGDKPEQSNLTQPTPAAARTVMPIVHLAATAPAIARISASATRRLRIGMVAYTFYETDNRVMRYAETLARTGHEVEVFALRRPGALSEEMVNGVRVLRLQHRHYDETTRFSYAWKLLQFFVRSFLCVSARDIRKKYDLLHIHSVPDMLVFTALLPRLRGTPVILDIHDILPEFYASKFKTGTESVGFKVMCAAEKACGKFSSHIIIANDIWRERLISRHLSADKCTVVLNSPDRLIFDRSKEPLARNGRFVMLYPGTLNWHQGLDIAVRAFARVSDQLPQADFYIYGNGPAKNDLIRMVEELKLDNRVFFKQSRRLREIAKIMESADLGIVPKRKDTFGNEAFSTKILEFMAMRVPVIVSDTQVDRYYFDDSVVRFFRGGDEEDLARQMLALAQDAGLRRQLVANASQFVDTIDWNAKQHIYLDLVERLMDSAPDKV